MRVAVIDNSDNGIKGPSDLDRALCGRLTCIKAVTDEWARKGWDVDVLTRSPRPPFRTPAGVQWTTGTGEKYDWAVFVRGLCATHLHAERVALWTRDLPHLGFVPDPALFEQVDRTVFLSDYGEKVWRTLFPKIGASEVIPNGVDRTIFHRTTDVSREPILLYASAPNRGLKHLPQLHGALKEIVPGLRTVALSNLSILHPGEVTTSENYSAEYEACWRAGVELMDPVPQRELAGWLQRAAALVKPSDYPEICSNLELQALACGCPVISTAIGSTPEFVADGITGLLTKLQPRDGVAYQAEFLRLCRDAFTIRFQWREEALDWREVAERWVNLFA